MYLKYCMKSVCKDIQLKKYLTVKKITMYVQHFLQLLNSEDHVWKYGRSKFWEMEGEVSGD